MGSLFHRWRVFWFSDANAWPLGLLRFVLVGYLFLALPERFLVLHWSLDLPQEFMSQGLALRYSPLPYPISAVEVEYFKIAMRVLGAMAALGIFTRLTMVLFTAGYWYLTAVDSAWGWHDHGPSLVVQVLLVLAIAPGISAFSIERYFKHRNKPWRERLGFDFVTPRWGLQMIFILLSVFYFTSGFSKLRYGGVRWMDGKTLSFYMSGKTLSSHIQQYGTSDRVPQNEKWRDGVGLENYIYGARPSGLAKWIAASPSLCVLFSAGTIFFETLFPLVLLGGIVRQFFLISGIAFHTSIYFLMGISFFPWILIEFCLIDWKRLLSSVPSLVLSMRLARIKPQKWR